MSTARTAKALVVLFVTTLPVPPSSTLFVMVYVEPFPPHTQSASEPYPVLVVAETRPLPPPTVFRSRVRLPALLYVTTPPLPLQFAAGRTPVPAPPSLVLPRRTG